ncbi:MAG TPA: PAS domain-containing protein, partial [Bacteroidetes bacterium]|nr:PAS domain-containing protein [Bacteroidota bacterium]
YRSSATPHIETVLDVNRDFRPEIVARLDDRVTFLDSRFRPIAQLPSDHSRFVGLFHERPDRPPLILLVSDRPDGSRIYYLTRLQRQFVWPLPISWQGTLLLIFGVIAVGIGVTVSRRTRSRDATISTLRRALEFVPYGVIFIDENGVITFCNNRARELLSLEDMVVERRAFSRVLSSVALRPLRRILEKSFAGQEQRYRHRLALQFPQGRTQQLIVTATRIAPGRGRSAGRMVILYDPNGCPGGSQGEDWVSIARRVAHEVKNPLSTILLTIQRLQMEYRRRDPASSASYDPFTERIIGRVEYLEKVTQGFLKLLHLENPNFTQCDLRELVAQVVREFELGIPEGVTLQYKVEGEIPRIVADPDQIRSLLENLLANAVAAMADGGMLTVSLRLERRLHFPHTPPGNPRDFVLLRVRDTGCGMPKDVAQALMGEQRDENENNLGIGLTIVAKIVRIHEGFIDVMSEPGAGTTVDVYLPA